MTSDQACVRQAARDNLQSELLRELELAHHIIRNALNLMSAEQKCSWGDLNDKDGMVDGGITRANERLALFKRVEHATGVSA